MSEKENPSTGEAGGKRSGVLDHLKGAKSRDTESESVLAAEQEAAALASKQSDAPVEPAEGRAEKAKGSDDESAIRLRQRAAALERRVAELGPWAQVGMALQADPEGKALLDRMQRGEPLMAGDRQIAQERGLTRVELDEALNQRDAAKRQIDDITGLAEENLPDYKQVRKSPAYRGMMDAALAAVWNGTVPLEKSVEAWDDVQAARNYTAIAFAYKMYLTQNPKVREAAKEAGRREASEKAASALAGELSSGGTSTSSGERETTAEQQLIERMVNARGVGKSFAKAFRA